MNESNQSVESSHSPIGSDRAGNILGHLWASIAATIVLGIICCGFYPLIVYAIGQLVFPIQANGSLLKEDGAFTTNDSQAVGSALIGQNFSAPQYFHSRPSAAGLGYDATSSGGSNLGPLSDKLINGATATQPAPAAPTAGAPSSTQPVETLAYDGVRLRCIHYALDNGISFKLYTVKFDDNGNILRKTEVPLSKFQDKDGNLLDTALVDAFPHAGDPPDKSPLIAADFSTPIPADAVTASASGLDPDISPANAALQIPRIAKARNLSQDTVKKLVDRYTTRPALGIFGDPAVNVLRLNLALDQSPPSTTPASPPAK